MGKMLGFIYIKIIIYEAKLYKLDFEMFKKVKIFLQRCNYPDDH